MAESHPYVAELRLLAEIAILCSRQRVPSDNLPIYEAWRQACPTDALGAVGIGVELVDQGRREEGLSLIEAEVQSARTRREMAAEVLRILRDGGGAPVTPGPAVARGPEGP